MAAPEASPKKETNIPFQKPKNKMLAAVIKKLGTTPSTAIIILIQMLITMAKSWYSLKNWSRLFTTYYLFYQADLIINEYKKFRIL